MDPMSSLTSGIDIPSLDPLVRPQDDLFRHYNGKWITEYEMPADRSSDGIFRKLHDAAEAQVRQIIETSQGAGEAQKIGDLYKSFMDTDAIKARGISPITEGLAAIDGITNLQEFITVMARLEMRGIGGIFGAAIFPMRWIPIPIFSIWVRAGSHFPMSLTTAKNSSLKFAQPFWITLQRCASSLESQMEQRSPSKF